MPGRISYLLMSVAVTIATAGCSAVGLALSQYGEKTDFQGIDIGSTRAEVERTLASPHRRKLVATGRALRSTERQSRNTCRHLNHHGFAR